MPVDMPRVPALAAGRPAALLLLALALAAPVLAAGGGGPFPEGDGVAWAAMIGGLLGGLALFLFGMDQMAGALKAAAGEGLRSILARLTTNRVMGAFTGCLLTAVVQSSSVTSVLVVGFVSAGLMTLQQSASVIMGASIGTTVTGQIVAFNVTAAALPMLALGYALLMLGRVDRARHLGALLMGRGLVFFSMAIMGDAMRPLRAWEPFLALMRGMESPLQGILVGTLFTALVQSSSATTGIVIVMASQGFITLEAGIALALGANLGTCMTGLLASIGKHRNAMRSAVIHIVFKLVGVAGWLLFIPALAWMAVAISPVSEGLEGMDRLAAEAPRQIANANTLFNLITTVVLLPFTGLLAAIAMRLVPDPPARPAAEPEPPDEPGYLHPDALKLPSVALVNARLETCRMGLLVTNMLRRVRDGLVRGDLEALRAVPPLDDRVDAMHQAIIDYVARLDHHALGAGDRQQVVALLAAVTYTEGAGDVVQGELCSTAQRIIEQRLDPSDKARAILDRLHGLVEQSLAEVYEALAKRDAEAAKAVMMRSRDAHRCVQELLEHQARRFADNDPAHAGNVRLETQLMESLKRLDSLAGRLASTITSE